ncbi:MAG: glycosyltransferase family 4 protein [Planctomycetota bacterium]
METTVAVEQGTGGASGAAERLRSVKGRPLRVYVMAGPGDVRGTFEYWAKGEDDPANVAIPYSHQVYDALRAISAEALVESSGRHEGETTHGTITVRARPRYRWGKGGAMYHLREVMYGLSLVWAAKRFRADVLVCMDDTFYAGLWLAKVLRMKVVVSLHNTFWARGTEPSAKRWRKLRWNGWAWRRVVDGTLGVSPEVVRQVERLAGGAERLKGPAVVQVPQYRRGVLRVEKPPAEGGPFTVMYAGRLESVKGVFLLLEAAVVLEREMPGRVRWVFCGGGNAIEAFKAAVREEGAKGYVEVLGQLEREQVVERVRGAHVLASPTTTGFAEGLAKVPIEAALSGRPSVVSSVVPAADLLGDAVVEVPADDAEALADAVRRLANDAAEYERHRAACAEVAEAFYDRRQSLATRLVEVLGGVFSKPSG